MLYVICFFHLFSQITCRSWCFSGANFSHAIFSSIRGTCRGLGLLDCSPEASLVIVAADLAVVVDGIVFPLIGIRFVVHAVRLVGLVM